MERDDLRVRGQERRANVFINRVPRYPRRLLWPRAHRGRHGTDVRRGDYRTGELRSIRSDEESCIHLQSLYRLLRSYLSSISITQRSIPSKVSHLVVHAIRWLISVSRVYPVKPGDHSPETLRNTFLTSLQYLKRDRVRVLYLHAPDRSVPFQDTVREVNNLYKEGKL